jgi:hypothetical protein
MAKIRTGFVSNSSSSSFVLDRKMLTKSQEILIKNYGETAHLLYDNDEYSNGSSSRDYIDDSWTVDFEDDHIKFDTSMDNFNMNDLLEKIGVPSEAHIDEWHSNDCTMEDWAGYED